jgi:lipoprotein-anchoring transpeptidase ErfK/SrfK
VFTVLEKAEEHYSSEFDDAPMPHMERLIWQGVALHAGKGYPASHGRVRLPPKFATALYEASAIAMFS